MPPLAKLYQSKPGRMSHWCHKRCKEVFNTPIKDLLYHPRATPDVDILMIVSEGICKYGPLARYVKLRVVHVPGMPGTFFSPPPLVSDPDMHHRMCVMPVPWCMPGSLLSGFLWRRSRGRRFTYLVKGPWNTIQRHDPCVCTFHQKESRSSLWKIEVQITWIT